MQESTVSTSLPAVISTLQRLPPSQLDETCRRMRGALGSLEWRLSAGLLAVQRSRAFRKLGYATISEYAARALQLSGKKAAGLLRVGKVLEHHPRLSEAFRLGKLSWGKIRALQSTVTPETEEAWLEYALAHSEPQVLHKVSLSPRAWKRQQALKASLRGEPIANEATVVSLFDASKNTGALESKHRQADAGGPSGEVADRRSLKGSSHDLANSSRPHLTEELDEASSEGREAAPSPHSPGKAGTRPPRFIRLTFQLTPDQYALYEASERRVRSQAGRCLPRATVLTRMAETILDAGTSRSRAKHQVLIHTVEDTDLAWYDTERGPLPVDPAILDTARTEREPLHVHSLKPLRKSDNTAKPSAPPTPSLPLNREGQERPDFSTPTEVPGRDTRIDSNDNAHRQADSHDSGEKRPPQSHTQGSAIKKGTRPANPRNTIPIKIIRQLEARAAGRCERCRAKGVPLQIHHVKPVSEGGGHALETLRLYCTPCHSLHHEEDYIRKPSWHDARRHARNNHVRTKDTTEPP